MRGAAEPLHPELSTRERQVLLHLEGQQDKEIAAALGLTAHGVRHHMRRLFVKLASTGGQMPSVAPRNWA